MKHATTHLINDVTGLNPVPVREVITPASVDEVREAVRTSRGAISVGGGRFSMGGQTASPGSLHLDLRRMNQIVWLKAAERVVRVQAGARWCDIQQHIDAHDLSIKIMQTYANFTVGGSLSVNVHGRYVGLGPLILSVRALAVVMADGELVEATPASNAEIFYGVVGGYGGLGVIVEAELELAENVRVKRHGEKMPLTSYLEYFRANVRNSDDAVFHNADLYPPHYRRVRAVTWSRTDAPATVPYRLMRLRRRYPLHRYFYWAFSETPLGKWRREHLIEPLLYLKSPVHWRNYEAGYDVAELEPASRERRTYVLQEYFVPVDKLEGFVEAMGEILRRHRVNMVNVSIRHAFKDPGSLLAWAREEVFAFVLYYKQRVRENAKNRVAVWTRELIDAVTAVNGAYYLPYQAHATPEQFHRAYPRAGELFELKKKLDPEFRYRNVIWDTYYAPTLANAPSEEKMAANGHSEFHAVYSAVESQDDFYRFLQNVYRIYPEDRFHTLIKQETGRHASDEEIYKGIQARLSEIKPFLADLFYAVPALKKQKREMTRQTLELLGDKREIDGCVEIGSTGRYLSDLRKHARITGDIVMVHDTAPSFSPVDIVERGRITKLGRFVDMKDYAPISADDIADHSVDLVTCFIGLHHSPPDRVSGFMASIHRILRPGGLFIIRDHDVKTQAMDDFVALAHTVFNAGLKMPWEFNQAELRHFAPVDTWVERIEKQGFKNLGKRLLQDHDPSDNVLMGFVKTC